MNIIWAVRELCKGENGFLNMFDPVKSKGKLSQFTKEESDIRLFETLIYGSARRTLVEMMNDAYNFKEYAVKIHHLLMEEGLNALEAKKALEIFFKAFGFLGYREIDPIKVSTIVDDVGDHFEVEYEGEVCNDKEHGVGIRTCYSNGVWSSYDECVWIDGVMNGFMSAKVIEFGMFEVQRIGFVVNHHEIGRTKCICGEDEYYDEGCKFSVE